MKHLTTLISALLILILGVSHLWALPNCVGPYSASWNNCIGTYLWTSDEFKGDEYVGEWQNGNKAATKILSAYDRWVHERQSTSQPKNKVKKIRGRQWRCANEQCGKVTETPFRWVEGATTTFMCDSCRGKVEEVNDF